MKLPKTGLERVKTFWSGQRVVDVHSHKLTYERLLKENIKKRPVENQMEKTFSRARTLVLFQMIEKNPWKLKSWIVFPNEGWLLVNPWDLKSKTASKRSFPLLELMRASFPYEIADTLPDLQSKNRFSTCLEELFLLCESVIFLLPFCIEINCSGKFILERLSFSELWSFTIGIGGPLETLLEISSKNTT